MSAEDIIYKETMINAYKYGSAESKIVFQKIMSYYPELRKVDLHEIHGIGLYSADYHKVEYIYKDLGLN